jgi:membrane-associated phospholipid phosphatase
VRWRGWLVDVVLLLLLAGLTAALAAGYLLDLDVAVRDWADAHRPAAAWWVVRVLNFAGQGALLLVLALAAAVWVAWRHRSVRPLLPVAAAYLGLAGFVGLFKVLTDRAAPHLPAATAHREELFSGGLSYPSGHVANTIVWYGVLVLLVGSGWPAAARWGVRLALPALVALTNTYLAFHWLTDTVAGVLAGVLLDRALRRVDWNAVPLPRWLRERGWAGRVAELDRDPAGSPATPTALR